MSSKARSMIFMSCHPVCALAAGLTLIASGLSAAQNGPALYYNQDSTDFFWNAEIRDGKAGEAIDRYVDQIADAGVTVFLCNSNARRVNYRSRVWDAFWDGYDPAGPDDQPFLSPIAPAKRAQYRLGIGRMLAVHQEGVDYPARVIERCRQRKVSPWITLRMNDCHENDIPDHPFHGSFWVKNPQLRRQNCTGYFATCLDYAQPMVRDYFMALIEETLERYDIDGLELDFMRDPYLFSANKEQEGAPILTAWLREVRQRTTAAAARRGHPVGLGVRVPSRPETALGMGLDATTWARDGVIDLLVVTPRWATLEFGLPIPDWRRRLGDARVTIVGGLEILYRPVPAGPAQHVSPELARGAASLVLADGADAVYLFNYFPGALPPEVYQSTLQPMASLDSLLKLPRTIGVTYRDITAPGESYHPPLPAKGREAVFTMQLGPLPPKDWRCEAVLGFVTEAGTPESNPSVFLDGHRCEFIPSPEAKGSPRFMSYRIPVGELSASRTHELKVVSGNETPFEVCQVEVRLSPGP